MRASEPKVLIVSVEGMAILSLKILAQINDQRLRDAGLTHPELFIIFGQDIACRTPLRRGARLNDFDAVLG